MSILRWPLVLSPVFLIVAVDFIDVVDVADVVVVVAVVVLVVVLTDATVVDAFVMVVAKDAKVVLLLA